MGFAGIGVHIKSFWEELMKRNMDNEEALEFLKHFCWLVKRDDGEIFIRHGSHHHRTYLNDDEKEHFKMYMMKNMMLD